MDSRMWNFMANLMMHSTCLCVAVLESFYTKNLEKVEKIMNILEFSKKFQHFWCKKAFERKTSKKSKKS